MKKIINILIINFVFLVAISILLTDSATAKKLNKVRIGVPYIPNVQFTPLYVAQKKGFYAEEGLDVTIEYGFEHDFVALAAQGKREFAVASGDQVIMARANGLPITFVLQWYQRYPVALMIPESKNLRSLSDLSGKTVGLPGFFGASYVGWKALVFAAGINERAVNVKEIGFTQAAAVQQGLVDAAVVYIANEPIQLRNAGIPVQVIQVSDYINLVSNGLVVGDKMIRTRPKVVRSMVQATQKAIIYSIEHPDEAFRISRSVIPEITDSKAPVQRQVLEVSIELWKGREIGRSSRQAWQDSVDFMKKTGLINKKVAVDELFTNRFIKSK